MNQARISGNNRVTLYLIGIVLAGMLLLFHTAKAVADVGNFIHAVVPQSASGSVVVLPGEHISRAASRGREIGEVEPSKTLSLTIVLPVRNQAGLDQLVAAVSDPKSPTYGHYITPDEFAAEFGPSSSDVGAVIGYAESEGLTVTGITRSRLQIHLSGSAASVEKAFALNLKDYIAPDGTSYFAPDREPSLPSDIAGKILTIAGLDNAVRPHNRLQRVLKPLSSITVSNPQLFKSNLNGLAPSDVRSIYDWPLTTSTNGTGQTAAVVEFDTYQASDIATYDTEFSLPSTQLTNISIDGQSVTATPGDGAPEVDLDIDVLHMFAPESPILVYEEPDSDPMLDMVSKIADDDTATTISCSWGDAEDELSTSQLQSEYTVFQQMAAQGQTFVSSSGDSGAYDDAATLSVDDPAAQPYVTASGGTDLTDSAAYAYVSETSWADPMDTTSKNSPFGTGGGGGISSLWPIPTWQMNAFTAAGNPQGSLTMRNTPDVSLFGDFDSGGYAIYVYDDTTHTSGWAEENGTSATAPIWTGYLTGVNQARVAAGSSVLGFVNPAIYSIAEGLDYGVDFHDINDGSNNLFYDAVTGYDNSTGWGSFIGTTLASDLEGIAVPAITSFSPSSGDAGATVTITGTGFTGVTGVAFGSVAATIVSQTATQIVTTVPSGAVSAPIYVSTPNITVKSSTFFDVTYAPTIVSLTPLSGIVGSTLYIAGTSFATTDSLGNVIVPASSVTFDSASGQVKATIVSQPSSDWIVVTVPSGAVTGPVTVVSPTGQVTSSQTYTVIAPTITSFSPTSGAPGTSVTITGTNLSGASVLSFNGVQAHFTVVSGTEITATVPVGATTGTIRILTPIGKAISATNFSVLSGSQITSFSPTSGPVGTAVTVTGAGFSGATVLSFNGTQSPFTIQSGTEITTTVPKGATTGAIHVLTPTGTDISATSFTVTASIVTAPTIASFSPTSGVVGAGVTITGTGLTGATSVKLNGTTATIKTDTATSLTFTVPTAGTSGKVSVTTPGGTVTSTGSFTVLPPAPTIASFTPTTGLAATASTAGTSVTITGTNFTGATSVKFNGTAASFTISSATSIKTTVPASASTGKISVTTAGGTATSSASFTVTPVPTITSFTPTSGAAGTQVTVTGTNFTGTSSVKLGLFATAFKVSSSTKLVFTVPQGASTSVFTVSTPSGTAKSSSVFTVLK